MSSSLDSTVDIEAARRRISGLVVRSPLIPSAFLTEATGFEVFLKLESIQPTGSFKVRGAAAKMLAVSESARRQGVVTASTGNHGRAVAYMARRLGIPATVCIAASVPAGKVAPLRDLGARVEVVGDTQAAALDRACQIEATEGALFVHPFDDLDVIAGQGTIAAEIVEDLPGVATVVVPLSGGGLMAGVATGMGRLVPSAALVGVSMTRGPMMAMSVEAGRPVEVAEEPTLADSLRGGIGLGNRHTFEIVRRLVDSVVLVDEDAIWEAMRLLMEQHRLVVEGAGAVGVAAAMEGALGQTSGPVAIVISGANVELDHLAALLAGDLLPTR